MTTPDFPDFQDFPVWRQDPLNYSSNALNVPTTGLFSSVFPVDSFASIQVSATPTTGYGSFTMFFYDDAAGSVQTGVYTFYVGHSQTCQVVIPILGPYMNIGFNNPSGSAAVWQFWAIPSNIGIQNVTYVCHGNNIQTGSVAYGAGVQLNYLFPFIAGGPCHLHFDTATATQVFVVTVAIAFDGLTPGQTVLLTKPTSFEDVEFTLPPLPCMVTVKNTDTASHNGNTYAGMGT
jgi:hypothetical protein